MATKKVKRWSNKSRDQSAERQCMVHFPVSHLHQSVQSFTPNPHLLPILA